MVRIKDLKTISRKHVIDSEILFKNKRYKSAVYLCGYGVEIALKGKICKTLKWVGYPESENEFRELKSFKTHKLDVLLHLSGAEGKIKSGHLLNWSILGRWDPEMRYRSTKYTKKEAAAVILSAKNIMKNL